MNASLITENVIAKLRSRFGSKTQLGRSSIFAFGSAITCSINYSKFLRGDKFFFGISPDMADPSFGFEPTSHGEYVLLICGSVEAILVIPRHIMLEMLANVPTRRIDVFLENGTYILQTTKHPKLNVSEFLNAFSKEVKADIEDAPDLPDSVSRESR